jgi:hypothetical protein
MTYRKFREQWHAAFSEQSVVKALQNRVQLLLNTYLCHNAKDTKARNGYHQV